MGSISTPVVSGLTCPTGFSNAIQNTAYNQSGIISYPGGNGGFYSAMSIASTGVTGLTAAVTSGTLNTESGNINVLISGTPTTTETANFNVNLAGQNCSFSITVTSALTVVMCGNSQAWMRHNLGADTSLDPDIPVQGIHGNYYQWVRATVVADASTPPGPIAGWNTNSAPDGAWSDITKTINDPCPIGFRIPTHQQLQNLVNNATASNIGPFSGNASNFGSAKVFTCGANKLTFPITGKRYSDDGSKGYADYVGYYHSSSNSFFATLTLSLGSSFATPGTLDVRGSGTSIRCISE